MPLHQVLLEVSVPADVEVTPEMVRDLLMNQLPLNQVMELDDNKGRSGLVHWRQVRVRSLGVR